jgi:spore maturation protein CgeB
VKSEFIGLHILFIGANWHGSNSTSCKRAFRHLGCDVIDVDDMHFFPRWQSVGMRGLRKALRPFILAEFGNYIKRQCRNYQPELVFVFKGNLVKPEIIEFCKRSGAFVFNFYPDWDFGQFYKQFGNDFIKCMTAYDVLFTPKSYHIQRLKDIGAIRVEFLPYAYDPWCHYPVTLSSYEWERYQSDITFIGTWGEARAALMEQLVSYDFPYNLTIWGNKWEELDSHSPLRKYVKWMPAYGETQARILAGCKIALAFLRPPDLHTARSFEIPAYGAFMLAQRSAEHIEFFREDFEIACFDDIEELHSKIEYYLKNDDERKQIALAGYKKVTHGGHSYIDRMARVIDIYREMKLLSE